MKKFWIRALGVFVLLVAVRAATSAIAPLINNLLGEMNYSVDSSAIVAGVILAVGYICSIIGSMFGGRIADVLGPVKTFITTGLVFAIFFVLWAFTTKDVLFYIYRAILALCTGALYVALQSYLLGGAKKGSEGMAMGIYGLGFGVGTAIAGSAAGLAGNFGISRTFLVLGIVCLVAVVVSFITTLIDRKTEATYEVAAPPRKKGDRSVWYLLKNANSTVYFLLLIAFAYGFGTILFLQYLDELGAARGMIGTQAAFGVAVFSIISMLQPLSGMLADKIGRSKCILIGMILICIGWSCLALVGSLTIGIVLLFSGIAGIGTMLYTPASFALAQRSAVEGSGGLIRGLFQGATAIGSAISAMFGAVIYSSIGINNVFYLLIGSTVFCVIFAIILSITARKSDKLENAKG